MFENPRRGRQARNVTTNAPKILDLKSSSEQIFSRKLPLGAPDIFKTHFTSKKCIFGILKVKKKYVTSLILFRTDHSIRKPNTIEETINKFMLVAMKGRFLAI